MAVTYRAPVRWLAEFVHREGDIGTGFAAGVTPTEGIKGHQSVQNRRPEGYRAEVPVSQSIVRGDVELEVSGRIDGVLPGEPVTVEEIKTYRGDFAGIPAAHVKVHWAQAFLYAWMCAEAADLDTVEVQLCYLEIDSGEVRTLRELKSAAELEAFFDATIDTFVDWLAFIGEQHRCRDHTIRQLAFPQPQYRAGQRELAVAAYRAASGGGRLMVEAPTGIGKTLGVLFPAIKGLAEGCHEKVFYLTAKTVGRTVAEDTMRDMVAKGLAITSVSITAKDKICFMPERNCDPDYCPYARGYYGRIKGALHTVLESSRLLTREEIEAHARRHELCPFELSLDLARWSDVIVGDYGYLFSPTVYLRRFFEAGSSDYCFLIDEAHNLVDRGREMFSAALDKERVLALRRKLASSPALRRKLGTVNRQFLELRKRYEEPLVDLGHAVEGTAPEGLVTALRRFCGEAEAVLRTTAGRAAPFPHFDDFLEFYFDALHFVRISQYFGSDYVTILITDARRRKSRLTATLYCLNPGRLLQEGYDRGKSAVLFSATLQPGDYYRMLLGLEDAKRLQLRSPFPGDHLGVFVVPTIATRYRRRESSHDAVVETIEACVAAREGKYIVYLPSHAYLGEIADRFSARAGADVLRQTPRMAEEEREDFIARLRAPEPVVGFAVMGGLFGEAIDLPGDELIGAIIVGPGLPQLSLERDLISDHFEERGFDYAYRYPGMIRVLQTAGRVIRTAADRGIICLIDDRFGLRSYRSMFPGHWQPEYLGSTPELVAALGRFWTAAKSRSD